MASLATLLKNGVLICPQRGRIDGDAILIRDGSIETIGSTKKLEELYSFSESYDLEQNFVYPGFIDTHGHPLLHGMMLGEVNLAGCSGMKDIALKLYREAQPKSSGWVIGFGWNDALWPNDEVPELTWLDYYFPDNPLFLRRVDFHAAMVNSKALKMAGITSDSASQDIKTREGKLSGELVEEAVEIVKQHIPPFTASEKEEHLRACEEDCFRKGVTSVADAGSEGADLKAVLDWNQKGEGRMEIYPMGLVKDSATKLAFTSEVKTLKFFADGALGSGGARLKAPYSDDPNNRGVSLWSSSELTKKFQEAYEKGCQVCVHAIGDEAFSQVLDCLNETGINTKDLRWRIEHCQLVDDDDLEKFEISGFIPSMQPLQAVSDAGWLEEKMGKERLEKTYRFRSLLNKSGKIALNSDFPIEEPSVLKGFAAAISGRTPDGKSCIAANELLSRQEALAGFTNWGAFCQFEEDAKGLLKEGYKGDLTVLNVNLMEENPDKIREGEVIGVFKEGRVVVRTNRS